MGQPQTMPRKTIYIPESTAELVEKYAREGESFSATVVRLVELGAAEDFEPEPIDESEFPLGYIGSGEGPGDLGINAEKYLGLKPWGSAAMGKPRRNAIVPSLVVAEVDHLARKRAGMGAARRFLKDIAGGSHRVAYMTAGLMQRAAELDHRYADLNLGVVDGFVMAIDERLYAREVG